MTDRTATELYRDVAVFRETVDELETIFTTMFDLTRVARTNTHLIDFYALTAAEFHAAELVLHLRRIIKTQ